MTKAAKRSSESEMEGRNIDHFRNVKNVCNEFLSPTDIRKNEMTNQLNHLPQMK